jgi:hypothetical protein
MNRTSKWKLADLIPPKRFLFISIGVVLLVFVTMGYRVKVEIDQDKEYFSSAEDTTNRREAAIRCVAAAAHKATRSLKQNEIDEQIRDCVRVLATPSPRPH